MTAAASIQLLPDHIINKIAAGEVVDRPASVVKELVENAIDAGASSIEIRVVDGGLKLIEVADNGSGMDRDNAMLAIERHATSKIRHVDDIEHIGTLGFRGEALAAIASVSRFTLTTRRAEDLAGTEIRINGGRIEDAGETGCPPGTQIAVRTIFFNVPARRKFLKTAATELNHIRQVFMLYALGRPDIGLRLVVDEKEVYRLDSGGRLKDRIRLIYGSSMERDLNPVVWEAERLRITGMVSSNRLHRGDRSEQYLFVNGRPASAPVLGYALNEVYRDLLPRGRHPVVFLFLELPPDDVDVNVHPTKKEVRFRRAGPLRDAVMAALKESLKKPSGQPAEGKAQPADPEGETEGAVPVSEFLKVPDLPKLPSFDYPGKADKGLVGAPERDAGSRQNDETDSVTSSRGQAPWHWCRILGQVAGYYVILETDEGMIVMDPQAAHERVLFERMMHEAERRKIDTQGLLVPETINLPPVKAGLIRKHMDVFAELGFGISEFGGDTFILDAMPAVLGDISGEHLLLEVAEQLEMLGKSGITRTVLRESIIRAAAQSAVRTTTQLSREELEKLIADLSLAELPYTSPRGRPTLIFTSLQELKKKFGR